MVRMACDHDEGRMRFLPGDLVVEGWTSDFSQVGLFRFNPEVAACDFRMSDHRHAVSTECFLVISTSTHESSRYACVLGLDGIWWVKMTHVRPLC